ncbi:YdcH family protein [Telmatospirillum sp.]|uniref:YdcH family protein n=1 Tax=Telmatospirillum sp. TaxID=2079197 RepID=UPI00284618BD|nr:YdcH family protein [Telmatospirillum sp.]MDR3436852.1 YdcH family protein [Telmatospirillum sp.]
MSLLDRVDSLKAKHAALDAALIQEARRSLPDASKVAKLKFKKLEIKDELERLALCANDSCDNLSL